MPVEFDEGVNEYHLVVDSPNGRGIEILRYCPWCGGAAPESRRDELFARLTQTEIGRLTTLTSGLKTLEAVVQALGPPDDDLNPGVKYLYPETANSPPTAEVCRTLVYRSISDTAEVHASERSDGSVSFSFSGKPLGSSSDPRDKLGGDAG